MPLLCLATLFLYIYPFLIQNMHRHSPSFQASSSHSTSAYTQPPSQPSPTTASTISKTHISQTHSPQPSHIAHNSQDPCAKVYSPHTKSICICRCLQVLKRTTIDELALRCNTRKSNVSRVLQRLEEENLAKRIYRNDLDYNVIWIGNTDI